MKKVIFIFASAGLLFSTGSCNKDYTCVCNSSAGVVGDKYPIHDNHSRAVKECDKHETPDITCDLWEDK